MLSFDPVAPGSVSLGIRDTYLILTRGHEITLSGTSHSGADHMDPHTRETKSYQLFVFVGFTQWKQCKLLDLLFYFKASLSGSLERGALSNQKAKQNPNSAHACFRNADSPPDSTHFISGLWRRPVQRAHVEWVWWARLGGIGTNGIMSFISLSLGGQPGWRSRSRRRSGERACHRSIALPFNLPGPG